MSLQSFSKVLRVLILITTITLLFSIVNSVCAQEPVRVKKDGIVPGTTEETITYPDGTTIKNTYVKITKDGKDIELKIETSKVVPDKVNDRTATYDTSYQRDGVTPARTTIKESAGATEITNAYKEYNTAGRAIKGDSVHVGFGGEKYHYRFNPDAQSYDITPYKVEDPPKVENSPKPAGACRPKSTLGARPIFIDRASEALEYLGADVGFSFYGPAKGNSADTTYNPFSNHITTQLGAGANVFIAFASDHEFKYTLSGITVGPELRFAKGIFSGTLLLQGGVAKEQFKFDDYKDHESSFAIRTGITIDCWFSNKVAIDLAPQALMTKFGDDAEWNFTVGLGAVFKLGCWKK